MKKILLLAIGAITFVCAIACVLIFSRSGKTEVLPPSEDASQFVMLTDAVPDAILEIRYFGTYNFVGQRMRSLRPCSPDGLPTASVP